jgi:hypothetical protein
MFPSQDIKFPRSLQISRKIRELHAFQSIKYLMKGTFYLLVGLFVRKVQLEILCREGIWTLVILGFSIPQWGLPHAQSPDPKAFNQVEYFPR